MHRIDGTDRRICVRVGGKQRALHVWKVLQRLLQKLDARHPRHPLIDKEQRKRIISQLELLHQFQRSRARIGPHHAKSLPVLSPQIPLHRPKYVHVVINCENHWLFHASSIRRRNEAVVARKLVCTLRSHFMPAMGFQCSSLQAVNPRRSQCPCLHHQSSIHNLTFIVRFAQIPLPKSFTYSANAIDFLSANSFSIHYMLDVSPAPTMRVGHHACAKAFAFAGWAVILSPGPRFLRRPARAFPWRQNSESLFRSVPARVRLPACEILPLLPPR